MKGIINVNKPQNFTSHDCVAIVRRLVGVKRVGHTGTLDPMATGVLPICIGSATRIMEYLDDDKKEYRCTMQLGIDTDTCDIWGRTMEEKSFSHLEEEEIRGAFIPFNGEISQVPPIYSALKVKGKKLYEYARAGKEVEIKSRKVTIFQMDVEEICDGKITFRVICSKGTYLRSICRDVGNALGVGGAMSDLERLSSGAFHVEDAVDILDLKEMSTEEVEKKILPIDYPLTRFPKVQVKRDAAIDFTQGKKISCKGVFPKGKIRVYYEDSFLGMADQVEGSEEIKAHKVFHTEI